MEVVLLSDVDGAGKKGQKVNVKDGYALNYLFPKRLADRPGGDAARRIVVDLAKNVQKAEQVVENAHNLAKKLGGKVFVIRAKAHDGQLYGSVHKEDIAKLVGLESQHVLLKRPLRTIGEQAIELKLGKSITTHIVIRIEPLD